MIHNVRLIMKTFHISSNEVAQALIDYYSQYKLYIEFLEVLIKWPKHQQTMVFSVQIAQNFLFHVLSRWAFFWGHVSLATSNLTLLKNYKS
jgi:N-glycosylase/DNA lyase